MAAKRCFTAAMPAAFVLLVGIGLWICDTYKRAYMDMALATTASLQPTQSNEGGQVTIAARWQVCLNVFSPGSSSARSLECRS
jgi:hypothetical protein